MLAARGRAGASSFCSRRKLPVRMKDPLPAATWPTSKVPPPRERESRETEGRSLFLFPVKSEPFWKDPGAAAGPDAPNLAQSLWIFLSDL